MVLPFKKPSFTQELANAFLLQQCILTPNVNVFKWAPQHSQSWASGLALLPSFLTVPVYQGLQASVVEPEGEREAEIRASGPALLEA